MYVCLCNGITSQTVTEVVAAGACTSKEVAAACGAGRDCGRCRRTVRAIIATVSELQHTLPADDCVPVSAEDNAAAVR